ncbi:DoxX family protein [Endozoicomonas sp. SM1973]|uniref:DoxX family protein n=1 Tax=Spartinivicinus marinus TaxID=2994442 RepID=A0A853I1H0_9GAMM|nr:DoxX family protein [Spartinivicinus marinus]MCX4024885.1 DoxX family protein [Spartinivicinus marinus]NYZ66469.1 DoxX family protein [Spartinivicinus marinus]
MWQNILKGWQQLTCISNVWFAPVVDLIMRIYVGLVFWRSGDTKLDSWDTTLLLFEHEYNVPVISHTIAAYMATAAELGLSVLLIVGLGTRFAAAGLFLMTLVIELFVFPYGSEGHSTDHYYWMIILGSLLVRGGGAISVDYFLWKKWKQGIV